MADATITKRLIISGLTPAITVDDVKRRLSSFGSVKAVDGFGLVDGVGQPRKFGYVTLETTPSRLGKCMNVLNGSVWKGTKLRLGEAKPDYNERIPREDQEVQEPPKKRQRFDAVHAADMSLVTAENAAQRPGWKVSPIRPLTNRSKSNLKNSLVRKELVKKIKKVKNPDTRSTTRTIDMTNSGSTHLKGNLLDSVSLPVSTVKSVDDAEATDYSSDEEAASSTIDDETTAFPVEELPQIVQPAVDQVRSDPSLPTQFDMEREKTQTLNFLDSLFGGSGNEDDWMGRESLGSDVEMGELAMGDLSLTGVEPTFEEVPRTPRKDHSNTKNVAHDSNKSLSKSPSAVVDLPTMKVTLAEQNTATKLKDLFAPREEAAFSLLDHLDLDVALDEDLSFLDDPGTTDLVASQEPSQNLQVQPTPHRPHAQTSPRIVLDPRQALFFPLSASEPKESNKARQRDPYDLIRENGCYWRDPEVRFWNTESEEDIRKKWEASRGELTQSWKQRWREAGKVRRRKKLVDGDEQM